ncbi:MAG: hypothetical protein FWG03_05240 [Clostridiales bacterium]|nr:hypothetical protein [Clostridiales bacterium]
MFYQNIEDVIPEPEIVCVSPHYDDFLFFLGSYVLGMKGRGLLDTKRFTNISCMSRTNYQERDLEGNKDRSLKRLQYATGIRFIEDLECLDDLLGPRNFIYRVMGEDESQVRGKVFNESEGEMEMAFGSYETMDGSDWDILRRLEACILELAGRDDTAIVLPLSMKGHIDHFIVREAGVRAMIAAESKAAEPKAAFYFAEDKPYAGIMTDDESRVNDDFIAEHALADRAFAGYPKEILRLAYLHYPSQVDTIYDEGVIARNEQLKQIYDTYADTDRIYKWR